MTSTAQRIDQLADRLAAGTILECVENTYIPDREGYRITITKPGRRVLDAIGDDGRTFRLTLPTRARDVVHLDLARFRYRIGRDDHEAEWRVADE